MADIINLRQARKLRARVEKERVAAANRAKFGRSKAERQVSRGEEERMNRQLDGSRRELPDDKSE